MMDMYHFYEENRYLAKIEKIFYFKDINWYVYFSLSLIHSLNCYIGTNYSPIKMEKLH